MRNSRTKDQLRSPRITVDVAPAANGSLLYETGETRIICAASVDGKVPSHAEDRGMGWLTAEYTMLPYSTSPRTARRTVKPDGRSVEIQRLIGRSLRGCVDLSKMEGVSITVDCDVIQADGGTRTAAITAGYIALKRAITQLVQEGMVKESPLVERVAAVSAGYLGEDLYLDLQYSEDSMADIDVNVVMDGSLNIIELQGTGEKRSFSRDELDRLLDLAGKGITELFSVQDRYC